MAAVDWQPDRMADVTSSEDELLSSSNEEAEEAAAWLIDVGLGNVVESLMDGNPVDVNLANAAREEGLTSKQYQTVRRRVETLKATLKGRKTRNSAGHHQRPDCRDIFRDPEASHSGGSSGRSRSATPDSLDSSSLKTSSENLLLSPAVSPKTWSRSGSDKSLSDILQSSSLDDDHDGPSLAPNPSALMGVFTTPTPQRNESRRRRSFNQPDRSKPVIVKSVATKPNRAGFFSPTTEGHVAAADKKGIEIVKYKLVGTVTSSFGRRSNSDPFHDQVLPIIQQPRISLEDGLTHAQMRKLRQLALLELTTLMDNYNLAVRKRSRLRVRSFAKSSRERNVFGVPLKKLVEKDQARAPLIFTMLTEQLRQRHLDEEGLLRVTGNKQKINTLQKLIEDQWKGHIDAKDVGIVRNAFDNSGPHEVACLFKQFLRQLPESLFTHDCVELFAQVGDITNLEDQLKALNLLIIQLPDPNCQTLRHLLRFLDDVVAHQNSNRMTSNNIATVMGPNLFPPKIRKTSTSNNMECLTDGMAYAAKTNRITELLLIHQDELFSIPQDILTQLSRIKVK